MWHRTEHSETICLLPFNTFVPTFIAISPSVASKLPYVWIQDDLDDNYSIYHAANNLKQNVVFKLYFEQLRGHNFQQKKI
jgi:hypothetical protein